ncbi:MAG TPA: hypothetical protein DF984_04550 [Anaerolineaceae bacterium]|jgi:Fic family protein|nr:hypothetical protein [Anaerolineaceae bacterium]
MPEYKWRPIEDIPEGLYTYSDPDLRALENEWQEIRTKTSDEVLERILTEIKREWAIETGKIEGLYTLSKGITKTLIQHGISARLIPQDSTNLGPLQLTELLKDQQEVIEGLMDYVSQSNSLTLHYIRQMHQVFTRHQDSTEAITEDGKRVNIPLLKGDWKKWPNNPLQDDETIHEYCPPEQVQSEMEHLLALHQEHLEKQVSPEVEAAFLHHRFTQIHPFQDGNGRVARALASLVLVQTGDFPFVVKDDERAIYIKALEESDKGDLTNLIEIVVEKQKDLLYNVLRKSQDQDYQEIYVNFEERVNGYISEVENLRKEVERSNKITEIWKQSLNELMAQYEQKIKKDGLLTGSLISHFNENYRQVNTNSTNISLGATPQIIGNVKIFNFQIRFPNQKDRYILDVKVSEIVDGEIKLCVLLLMGSNGQVIDSFETSSVKDFRLADFQLRKWFKSSFGKIVSDWLNV